MLSMLNAQSPETVCTIKSVNLSLYSRTYYYYSILVIKKVHGVDRGYAFIKIVFIVIFKETHVEACCRQKKLF